MTRKRQDTGRQGEELAIGYVRKRGYRIIERNFRNTLGEIDIIARDGRAIVFIEVKARSGNRFGNPKYAVTRKNQLTLTRVAQSWLKEKGHSFAKARFDVIAICNATGREPDIELVKNAFEIAS